MKRFTHYILLTIGLFLIASCSSSDNGDTPTPDPSPTAFERSSMLTNMAENIIIPSYQGLNSSISILNNEIVDFVNNPTITNLESAREAHREAYKAWQKAAFFEVGPAKNENLRLYFNTYPVDVDRMGQVALADEYNLHLASNASVQGFPALDYLLNGFADTDEELIAMFTSHTNAEYYKDYTKALTLRLSTKTSDVLDAWQNGYKESFIANDGSSASASVDLIANDYLLYYEKFYRNGKLRFPVGYASGVAAPQNVESYYYPTLSKELFITATNSLQDFFEGRYYNSTGSGDSFKSYLDALDKNNVSQEILANFNTIKTTANNIDGTFRDAVENDRTAMLNLHDKVQENVIPMKVDMMQAMNISVAYFDGDGD